MYYRVEQRHVAMKEATIAHVQGNLFYYEVPGERDDWVYPHEVSD